MILIAGILAVGAAVVMYDRTLTNRLAKSSAVQFADSFHRGYACGILPKSKIKSIFGKELHADGTVISEYSPVASVRRGSPRVDSCSFTDPDTSANYVDLVIKSYDSSAAALDAYNFDTAKIVGASTRQPLGGAAKSIYASGVFYVLKNNEVVELGAGREGVLTGPGNEQFVGAILTGVVEDL